MKCAYFFEFRRYTPGARLFNVVTNCNYFQPPAACRFILFFAYPVSFFNLKQKDRKNETLFLPFVILYCNKSPVFGVGCKKIRQTFPLPQICRMEEFPIARRALLSPVCPW
jgi:hypothetical protein